MSCWLKLADRCAIITGAASGIGRAVAHELEQAGCRLVLVDQDFADNSGRAGVAAGPAAGNVQKVPCDVTDSAQVDSLLQRHSNASILVNCAGITRDGFIGNLSEANWDQVINVNLKGTFLMCQSFLKHSTAIDTSTSANTASIINVGSVVSQQGNLGQVNYAASKGGVLGLTRCLAKETARRGVRVNAVLPGFIATPMTDSVPEHVLRAIQPKIALGHFGKPQDVANLIAFLASERSCYITGEAIECSGMISL